MARSLTQLERFLAVVEFRRPDYWPILTAHAIGYPHAGAMPKLHREGLPEWVNDHDSWCRYWGTFTFLKLGNLGEGVPPVKTRKWVEGGFEFVRSETGALTRQVIDNDMTYSMPDFIAFDVRDRASWETYRDRMTPRATADIEQWAAQMDGRDRPAAIHAGSTWGRIRDWMGPEKALLAFYDQPDLLADMLAWQDWMFEQFVAPVMHRYRPEVITWWEDFCYNHGLLISPAQFRQWCAPRYRKVAQVARDCGAKWLVVDCDGLVNEYLGLLEEVGFNGCWPMEQVCGNDLLAYRRVHPRMVMAGGIEKEVVSTGGARRIRAELLPRIPRLLEAGGYFPSFDHGQSTLSGFEEHCKCFTLLHQICGSPPDLGEFPRMHAAAL